MRRGFHKSKVQNIPTPLNHSLIRNLKVQDYKLEQHVSESYTGCSVYCLIILFLLNKFEVIKKLTSSKPYTNIRVPIEEVAEGWDTKETEIFQKWATEQNQ